MCHQTPIKKEDQNAEIELLEERARMLQEAATAKTQKLYALAYSYGAAETRVKNNCRYLPSNVAVDFSTDIADVREPTEPMPLDK